MEKHHDQPPPPYHESAAAPPSGSLLPTIQRQFPPAFSMYKNGYGQRHYTLGTHQSQPLYAVSLHSGWSGQADVVLHSGADDRQPPLATVNRGTFSRDAVVTLPPPLPGHAAAAAQESVEHVGVFGNPTYRFAIETTNGGRESFEWRHSRSADVQALGGRGGGWKLVRLAGGGGGGGGSRSSDGKEVVAVWSWATMSLTKVLRFEFLGAGAAGALGERWAVMAVISALSMWDHERRARNSSAAAGGGGGGA
ncbi:hypothetical protein F4779DRAFT_447444 [Xylariaceae sp. FL0662B]|nr:hypothetical protein F4779DRAFT_447444 [Xylariaceae sp. FL0662B]